MKPTPVTRTQAAAPAASLSNIKAVPGSAGVYEYTFPAPQVTAGMDRTKTHTVAGWISRVVGTTSTDTDAAGGSLNFVPAGGTPQKDEVVTDAACNKCHGFVQAHGSRRTTQLCITCHSPQTGDPETDRTVDFKVMIHKIHSGETLKSVPAGEALLHRRQLADRPRLVRPRVPVARPRRPALHRLSLGWRGLRQLAHEADAAACTSCHDNVQFAGSFDPCPAGTAAPSNSKDCMHRGGPISVTNVNDVATCQGCHGAGAANAIDKYHHGD